jgi:hypothetical protein
MRPQALSKLVSGFFCSLLFAAYIHHNSVRDFGRGKEAFLAEQARHFDRSVVLNARTPLPAIIGAVFVLGTVFVVYELIAAFASRFIDEPTPVQQPPQQGQPF